MHPMTQAASQGDFRRQSLLSHSSRKDDLMQAKYRQYTSDYLAKSFKDAESRRQSEIQEALIDKSSEEKEICSAGESSSEFDIYKQGDKSSSGTEQQNKSSFVTDKSMTDKVNNSSHQGEEEGKNGSADTPKVPVINLLPLPRDTNNTHDSDLKPGPNHSINLLSAQGATAVSTTQDISARHQDRDRLLLIPSTEADLFTTERGPTSAATREDDMPKIKINDEESKLMTSSQEWVPTESVESPAGIEGGFKLKVEKLPQMKQEAKSKPPKAPTVTNQL